MLGRTQSTGFVWALFLVLGIPPLLANSEPSVAETLFALRVKPLLETKCAACHGAQADKLKGGFNLTVEALAFRGGDSGQPAIVPGQSESSLLFRSITWEDPELEMPPKEKDRLTSEQVEWVKEWIELGALWLDDARVRAIREQYEEGVKVATSGGLSSNWTERRYKQDNLWAYQPISKPAVPWRFLREGASQGSAIDAFINRRLHERGVPALASADRRTLIRRVTFDLTGLPPTWSEISDFLNDRRSEAAAFADVVERLLASPQYGERWARHWLDVARYADSSGLANDYERGNAWRYRDYVVRSFNQDKAYDQFIREQIAGDELDPENPEMLVAVGFLRMGPWELTGMEVAKLARQRFLDDVTDSVGQVFLSHPLQCARCHDHKFDPIPTRDYYRVQAAFATTQLAERRADFLPSENTRGFEQRQYFERRLARLQQIQRALGEKERRAAMAWAETRGFDYIPRSEGLAKGVPEERLAPRKVGFEIRDYGMERIARKGQERLRWILERYEPFALSVFTGKTPNRKSVSRPTRMPAEPLAKGTLEKTAILTGGDPFSPAETVVPGGLSVLPDYGVRFPKGIQGRRLALADWIAHPQNPLMARSLVNRVWQWHFGRGLAGHANNFGATGKRPTHPELLDWLAAVFVEDGFSLKKLHRRIVLSEAYRRASAGITAMADRTLGTSLYGAFEPRRLMAEEIWDSMLAISGELNLVVGGIPSKPEMNLEAAMQPRMVMGTFAEAWQPAAKPQDRHRRALYTLRLRGHQDPFLEVLNAPTNDLSCEAREPSTVSTQAFGLLNGDFTNGRAIALAARLRELDLTREATIVRLYQDVLGREPTSKEIELCLDHWSAMENRHKAIEHKPRAYPREIRRRAVEENTGEKFDYVEVLDFYSDFEPDRQRSDLDAETNGLADVCLVLLNANEFVYLY